MDILIITGLYDAQPKSGGSHVMRLYVEELRRQGHTAYVVYGTSADKDPLTASKEKDTYYLPAINNEYSAQQGPIIKLIRIISQKWQALNPKPEAQQYFYRNFWYLQAWLHQFMATHPIDVVQVDFPWMMNIPEYLPAKLPVVFVSHETQGVVYKRKAQFATDAGTKAKLLAKAKAFEEAETALVQRFDAVYTLTDIDQQQWQSVFKPNKVAVSTLGIQLADGSAFKNTHAEKVVFLANAKHQPNVDAIRYFISTIWPLVEQAHPTLTLNITGDFAPDVRQISQNNPRIVWEGFVDSLPALMHSAISIVPILVGSGIRIKILESMGMKVPVVSTAVGAEGIVAVNGESILLAEEPADFAKAILQLANDDAFYQKIALGGRQIADKYYNVKNTTQHRIDLFRQLIKSKQKPA
jgi:glycosyltransferase involved in cell wall biosynthesis